VNLKKRSLKSQRKPPRGDVTFGKPLAELCQLQAPTQLVAAFGQLANGDKVIVGHGIQRALYPQEPSKLQATSRRKRYLLRGQR
jgi:hypothetical protein